MNTIYAEYNMYHNSIDIYTIFIVSGTIVFKLHNIIRRIQSIQKSIRRAVFPFHWDTDKRRVDNGHPANIPVLREHFRFLYSG